MVKERDKKKERRVLTKLHRKVNFMKIRILFCSVWPLLCHKPLEPCLVHGRHPLKIYWMNEYVVPVPSQFHTSSKKKKKVKAVIKVTHYKPHSIQCINNHFQQWNRQKLQSYTWVFFTLETQQPVPSEMWQPIASTWSVERPLDFIFLVLLLRSWKLLGERKNVNLLYRGYGK